MTTGQIDGFVGDFIFLSNEYKVPIHDGGIKFNCLEIAYYAAISHCHEIKQHFSNMPLSEVRKYGNVIVTDVDDRVLQMMLLLRKKFSSPRLSEMLLLTDGYSLNNTTSSDMFWGTADGRGQNALGVLLEDTRDWLKTDRIF